MTHADLALEVRLTEKSLHLGEACPVEITLRNVGKTRLLVNRRLAVGYNKSLSRELFADLVNLRTGKPTKIHEVDYDRDFPRPSDYSYLEPGESVFTSFDLFEWYAPVRAGSYQLTIHYQADEPLASPPGDVVRGVYSGDPVDLVVAPKRRLTR